jgi:hypothetical protein
MFTAIGFALAFAFTLVYALARDPMFGLFAYFAAFFVHPPSRWWGASLPDLRWVLLAGVVSLAAIYLHREKLAPKPHWLSTGAAACFAAYCAWLWMQYPWALGPDLHWNGTVQYTKYLVAFYLVYRIVDSKERVRDLLLAHAAGCGLLGLIATFFAGRMLGDRLNGVGGPGIDDANSLAMYLATGSIAAAGLILAERGWRRYAALVALAFSLNGMVLANSRGAFLGLLAGGLVFMLLKASAYRRLFWVLAVLGIFAAGSIMDQRFINRMLSIKTTVENREEVDSSAQSRFVIIEAQVRMFLEHPHGAGYRGTAVLSPRYLERQWLTPSTGPNGEIIYARSSHNTYLTVLVEQGIVGALIFSLLLVWFAKSMLAVRRWNKSGGDAQLVTYAAALCGGFVVVLVAGLATDYLAAEVQFWLLAGLTSALQLQQKADRPVGVDLPLRATPGARAAGGSVVGRGAG